MNHENFMQSHYEMAKTLLMTLGKIPAPSHFEDQRAAFCKQWFIDHKAKDVYIDQAKNVICKVKGRRDDLVIMMAHMDVVFDDRDELPMVKDGNILRCPGIGDDTANLVNLLMGYLYVLDSNIVPEYTLLFVCNACEEGLGNLDGCKEIMKKYAAKMAYFYSFDGYIPGITSRAVGSYRYKITIKTEGGHSYGAFGNKNAIVEMSKLILDLDQIELPKEVKTTYNVGVIEGGSTVNSIAQECSILYEFRSESMDNLEYMQSKLNAILTQYRNNGIDIENKVLGIRPGSKLDNLEELDAWTNENIKIVQKYTDRPIALHAGSTDANIPLSFGLKANTIGTVIGKGAHTREEWVDLTSLKQGMLIVLDVVEKYM